MSPKYKGVLCILTSAFFFALMNLFVRLSGDLPVFQKSFFRNLVAMIFALVILLRDRPELRLNKGDWGILLLRATFGTVGVLGNFYAVDHLLLADATMLNKMSPFFAILLGAAILGERLRPFQIGVVVAAFVGALLVIKPTGANMAILPALVGLMGGFAAGVAYTMVRLLGKRGVPGSFIVFFFSAFSCLAIGPLMLADFVSMTGAQWMFLLLAGLCAAAAQFAITSAYCYAPAREISVFDYSQILFSALFGFLVFNQIPDALSWLGYLVIGITAIANFLYNTRSHTHETHSPA